MRQHIIVPFDGSVGSQAALRVAIEIAKNHQEKILLLNVQLNLTTPGTMSFFKQSDIQLYQEALYEETVQEGLKIVKDAGVEYEAKLLIGIPKFVICEEAKTRKVRYIVMGSRGLSAFVGSVLGSVSQGVLQLADCPVMIVPTPSNE